MHWQFSARQDVTVLAGGTDVYPAKTTRAGWGETRHRDVLDISRIPDLRGIEDRGDHWWIGALTTWSELIKAELPPLFDGLKAAAREVGGVQIQNRGTIAGNCCTASPAGDGIPCLLTLEAEMECVGGTVFRVPLYRLLDRISHNGGDGLWRTGHRHAYPEARRAWRFRQAWGTALSGDLDRHGCRRDRDR